MGKLVMFVLMAFLIGSVLSASTRRTSGGSSAAGATCGRHGDPCSVGCCANLRCHPYANRCQVIITEADLMAQREKILGRRGKDYRK